MRFYRNNSIFDNFGIHFSLSISLKSYSKQFRISNLSMFFLLIYTQSLVVRMCKNVLVNFSQRANIKLFDHNKITLLKIFFSISFHFNFVIFLWNLRIFVLLFKLKTQKTVDDFTWMIHFLLQRIETKSHQELNKTVKIVKCKVSYLNFDKYIYYYVYI